MKRRIALGYFAVSIAAVLLGFGLDRISLFTYFLWIFLGPISFLGFAAIAYRLLPVATEMVTYHTEMVTYYAVATLILGGLLWFMPSVRGVPWWSCQAAMVLVWLTCAGYNFWLIGQG